MLCTDRTVAVERVLETNVVIEDTQIDAASALRAVFVIDSQSLANTTQTAVLAVKDGLVGIREQMTNVTIILGQFFAASFIAAVLSSWLDSEAMHAHHLFDCIPIDLVVAVCVMTKTTSVKTAAAWCTDLCLTWVMRASKNTCGFVMIRNRELV